MGEQDLGVRLFLLWRKELNILGDQRYLVNVNRELDLTIQFLFGLGRCCFPRSLGEETIM